ncbi:putative leucine-rich repeat domain superfamily [Dioscorea sansibarensis]
MPTPPSPTWSPLPCAWRSSSSTVLSPLLISPPGSPSGAIPSAALSSERTAPPKKPAPCRLDAIGSAKNLEDLKLWGVSLTKSPNWGCSSALEGLEIVGAAVRDTAIKDVVQACPKLVELALLGCDGCSSVSIELDCLEKCRLDFLGSANSSVHLSSPKLAILELQGFSWIHVKRGIPFAIYVLLKLQASVWVVYKVDVGKLPDLEYLSIRGVQWSWNAISSVLHSGSEVKHLLMKIEFTGDLDTLQRFPKSTLLISSTIIRSYASLKSKALCLQHCARRIALKFGF